MQQNPGSAQRNSDDILFQGWSLALDSITLPPVTATELARLFTLSRLAAALQVEMQTLNQISQDLSIESNHRELDALIREAQLVVPKASALYGAINQMSEGRHRTALQETGQIILGCLESAQSSASLLLNVIEDQEAIAEAPTAAHSPIIVESSLYSSGDLTSEGKEHNVTTALALMTLLLEDARQEIVSTPPDSSRPMASPSTFSPSVALAISQLHILLQQDTELPHRIIREFVTTAFQSSADPKETAERLTMILSLFERFKDTSLQLGSVLRTFSALAAQTEETTNSYLNILSGESSSKLKGSSKLNLISIIKSNVKTSSGGLNRLCRLLDYSIASNQY